MEVESYLEFPSRLLTVWDYLVLFFFVLCSLAIGIYQAFRGAKQNTTEEYLLASQKMGVFAVAMSSVSTIFTANILMTLPVDSAFSGIKITLVLVGFSIALLLTGYIFTPVFYSLKIFSIHDYLGKRFGSRVKTASTLINILTIEFSMAVMLYLPAFSLNIVTGLDQWISVGCIGIISVVYTTIGGMKAVLWTDVLQLTSMFFGIMTTFISGLVYFGDFKDSWSLYESHGRTKIYDYNLNLQKRLNFWIVLFGSPFFFLTASATSSPVMQRALCMPSLTKAKISMLMVIPITLVIFIMSSLNGVILFRQYHACDPLKVGRLVRIEGTLPLYVMEKLYFPGVPGLVFVSFFSGALSSISSNMNSIAAMTYENALSIRCGRFRTQRREVFFLKLITLISGVVMMLLTPIISKLGFLLDVTIFLWSVTGGPILGVVFMGLFIPWCNSKGALVGLIIGVVFGGWVSVSNLSQETLSLENDVPPMSTLQCFSMYGRNSSNLTSSVTDSSTSQSHVTRFYFDQEIFLKEGLIQPLTNFSSSLCEESTTLAPTNQTKTPKSAFARFQSYMMPLYQISIWFYTIMLVFVTMSTGFIASVITGCARPRDVDPRLLSSLISRFIRPSKHDVRELSVAVDEPISLIDKNIVPGN